MFVRGDAALTFGCNYSRFKACNGFPALFHAALFTLCRSYNSHIRKLCGIRVTLLFNVFTHRLSVFTEYFPAVLSVSTDGSEPHVQCPSLLSQSINSSINLSEAITVPVFGASD